MSDIILATEADARELLNIQASSSDNSKAMSRAARKAADKEERKDKKKERTALTYRTAPKFIAVVVSKILGPDIARMSENIADVGLEVMALVEVLEAKGILSQSEIDAQRVVIQERMQKLHEASVAAQNQTDAPVNESSPAFQEASKNAGGAQVRRLDEGRPSTIEIVTR